MTKQQIETLERALDTLQNGGSGEIRELLDGPCRIFLQTWVNPLIDDVIRHGKGEIKADAYRFWTKGSRG